MMLLATRIGWTAIGALTLLVGPAIDAVCAQPLPVGGAATGDLDADGVADELVARPGAGAALGEVTVRSGATGTTLFTVEGAAPGTLFGLGAVLVDDLDADGVADLLVPAPLAFGGDRGGRIDGFSGADGAPLFSIWPARGESLTSVVASAPDLFRAAGTVVAAQVVEVVDGVAYTSWIVVDPLTGERLAKGPDAEAAWPRLADPPLASATVLGASDLDGDGVVGPADFTRVLHCFADPTCDDGDVDGDGAVNALDLVAVMADFGGASTASDVPDGGGSPLGGGAMAMSAPQGGSSTFLFAVGTDAVVRGEGTSELTISEGALVDLGGGLELGFRVETLYDDQGNYLGHEFIHFGYDTYFAFAPGPIRPLAPEIAASIAIDLPEHVNEGLNGQFATGDTSLQFFLSRPQPAATEFGVENIAAIQPAANDDFGNRLALFFGQIALDTSDAEVTGEVALVINDSEATITRTLAAFDETDFDHQAVIVYTDLPATGTPGEPRKLAALYWISADPPWLPAELAGEPAEDPADSGSSVVGEPRMGGTLELTWDLRCPVDDNSTSVNWQFTLPGSDVEHTAAWSPDDTVVDADARTVTVEVSHHAFGLDPAAVATLTPGDQIAGHASISTPTPGYRADIADVNDDGVVDGDDFLLFLVAFGSNCGPDIHNCDCCPHDNDGPCVPFSDFDYDCDVDGHDFVQFLVDFGTVVTCGDDCACEISTGDNAVTLTISPMDSDCDGILDDIERLTGDDPLPPIDPSLDTDADGYSDRFEAEIGLIVGESLACGGVIDAGVEAILMAAHEAGEFVSNDGDYLPDSAEEAEGLSTEPGVTDSDGDGLSDIDEIFEHHTKPNDTDTDGDTLDDGFEALGIGSDPLLNDTDTDGVSDGVEFGQRSSPTDPDDSAPAPPLEDEIVTIDFDPGPSPGPNRCGFDYEISIGDHSFTTSSGGSWIFQDVTVSASDLECAALTAALGGDPSVVSFPNARSVLPNVSVVAIPKQLGCLDNRFPDLSGDTSRGVPSLDEWPFDPSYAAQLGMCDCPDPPDPGCNEAPVAVSGVIGEQDCDDVEPTDGEHCPQDLCDLQPGEGLPTSPIETVDTGAWIFIDYTDGAGGISTVGTGLELLTDQILYNWTQLRGGGLAPDYLRQAFDLAGLEFDVVEPFNASSPDGVTLPVDPDDPDSIEFLLNRVNSQDHDFDGVPGTLDGFDFDGLRGGRDYPEYGDDLSPNSRFLKVDLHFRVSDVEEGIASCDDQSNEELSNRYIKFHYWGSAPWEGEKLVDLDGCDQTPREAVTGGIIREGDVLRTSPHLPLRVWTRDADRPRIAEDAGPRSAGLGHYIVPE